MTQEGPLPPTPPHGWLSALLPVGVPDLAAARRRRRRSALIVLPVLLLIAAAIAWNQTHRSRSHRAPSRPPQPYAPLPPAFTGDSTLLHDTVIAPTLDTPIPPGKNVIWCSSFELAWNRLRNDVFKAPVRLAGAEAVTDRLNASQAVEADLSPESVYAAAGLTSEGIADRIRREMAERFPGHPAPQFSTDAVLAAYAYMQLAAKFTLAFLDNEDKFIFTDARGKKTAVTSFGLPPHGPRVPESLPEQVKLLYAKEPEKGKQTYVDSYAVCTEFAIDPCRTTTPYQIVVAVVPPQATLAGTLGDVASKIAAEPPNSGREFSVTDVLLIPNVSCRITHHFRELEGPDKRLLDTPFKGLYLATAQQDIDFRLDRSGAALVSTSTVEYASKPTRYACDRPFLIYMKKLDADRPFFALWVDNAELLSKPSPGS